MRPASPSRSFARYRARSGSRCIRAGGSSSVASCGWDGTAVWQMISRPPSPQQQPSYALLQWQPRACKSERLPSPSHHLNLPDHSPPHNTTMPEGFNYRVSAWMILRPSHRLCARSHSIMRQSQLWYYDNLRRIAHHFASAQSSFCAATPTATCKTLSHSSIASSTPIPTPTGMTDENVASFFGASEVPLNSKSSTLNLCETSQSPDQQHSSRLSGCRSDQDRRPLTARFSLRNVEYKP